MATAVGILFGGAAATHRRGDPRLLTDDGEDVYDPRSRIFIDGGSYDGDWVEGEMHGRGVYTYAHGESYDGDMESLPIDVEERHTILKCEI